MGARAASSPDERAAAAAAAAAHARVASLPFARVFIIADAVIGTYMQDKCAQIMSPHAVDRKGFQSIRGARGLAHKSWWM